jgi:hypothetical protein
MTLPRLVAIGFIAACVTLAWMILGTSVIGRTNSGYDVSRAEVEQLWGTVHLQRAPEVRLAGPGKETRDIELSSSAIDVDLQLEHRRRGLLWYATYGVGFDGRYTFANPTREYMTATVVFKFPAAQTIYDDFEFRVGGLRVNAAGNADSLTAVVPAPPEKPIEIHVAYKSRGLDLWLYSFADKMATVRDFTPTVNTDFAGYNFPQNTISPSTKTATPQGAQLQWRFENLVADFDVGVELPRKLNPGPLASRMSFFAPVSLLFFFTVLVVLGAVHGTSLHPMHYFFLGASFFAFHLLFAYLVDHLVLELAFVIAAAVSMALVISYLWRVMGRRFAVREAGVSQLLFLVLFSYAFFYEGYTGLVVTIGAVITLAVLMHVTAGVNWAELFGRKTVRPAEPVAPSPVQAD